MKIVVITPTYNESENIATVIKSLQEVAKSLGTDKELVHLVVDDNSPDRTADIVKDYQKKYKGIYLISGEKKGLGEAYIRGMRHAMDNLNTDIVIMMDADLQHDPYAIPKLLTKIDDGYDFVIGSRYIPQGTYPEEWGRLRVLNSMVANILAIHIAGIKGIKDCTSGYRVIRVKNILDKVKLDKIHAIGYSFQLMLLYAIMKQGAKVIEYPITFTERKLGKSKIGINATYLRDIAEFFINAFLIRFSKD